MNGLRILWVLPYFPWPVTNGGKARQDALLRALTARGHRITLCALARDMPSAATLASVAKLLDHVEVLPRRSMSSPITLGQAVFSLRPAAATINGCSSEFSARFEKLLRQGFDIVQVEHSYVFESLRTPLARHDTPFVLVEHNVESTVAYLRYSRFPWPLRQIAGVVDNFRCRLWERYVIRRAACVVAVSHTDEAHFRTLGARTTAVVPNCIDTIAHAEVRPDALANQILYIGNYEYSPNVAAVEWLCNDIMPHVWSSSPTTTLVICGYALPARWRARWPDGRIRFSGYVPSINPVHAASSVFVAPLRAGGGSKLKVIEALASGLPVVATREAVSGLSVQDGIHFRGAETTVDIASVLMELLNNPAAARRLGEAARAYAVRNHDWAVAADALEMVYAQMSIK